MNSESEEFVHLNLKLDLDLELVLQLLLMLDGSRNLLQTITITRHGRDQDLAPVLLHSPANLLFTDSGIKRETLNIKLIRPRVFLGSKDNSLFVHT